MQDDDIDVEAMASATAPAQPVEDSSVGLDDAINRALDGVETPDDAAAEPGRMRDERGRFIPRQAVEGSEDAAADAPDDPADPVDATDEPDEAPAASTWTDGHFAGWKPQQREAFSALPPEAQALLMERQAESQAFYQRKLSEGDAFQRSIQPLYEAAREVDGFARSIGMTPHDLLKGYAAIDYKLRYAPYAEKVQLLQKVAQEYGIPLAPQSEPDPFADPLSPTGAAYPVLHDLQSRNSQYETQLQALRQQMETMQRGQLSSTVDAFVTATQPDGSPRYPLFDVVRPAMAQLIGDGKAATLEDAYALAVKPIEDRIAAETTAKQKAAAEVQAKAVARAKKAAPVRSSGIAPGGKTQGGGIDQVLNATLSQFGVN